MELFCYDVELQHCHTMARIMLPKYKLLHMYSCFSSPPVSHLVLAACYIWLITFYIHTYIWILLCVFSVKLATPCNDNSEQCILFTLFFRGVDFRGLQEDLSTFKFTATIASNLHIITFKEYIYKNKCIAIQAVKMHVHLFYVNEGKKKNVIRLFSLQVKCHVFIKIEWFWNICIIATR